MRPLHYLLVMFLAFILISCGDAMNSSSDTFSDNLNEDSELFTLYNLEDEDELYEDESTLVEPDWEQIQLTSDEVSPTAISFKAAPLNNDQRFEMAAAIAGSTKEITRSNDEQVYAPLLPLFVTKKTWGHTLFVGWNTGLTGGLISNELKLETKRDGFQQISTKKTRIHVGYSGEGSDYRVKTADRKRTEWSRFTVEYAETEEEASEGTNRWANWRNISSNELIELVEKVEGAGVTADDLNGKQFIVMLEFYYEDESGKLRSTRPRIKKFINFEGPSNGETTLSSIAYDESDIFTKLQQAPSWTDTPQSANGGVNFVEGGVLGLSASNNSAQPQFSNNGTFRGFRLDLGPLRNQVQRKFPINGKQSDPKRYTVRLWFTENAETGHLGGTQHNGARFSTVEAANGVNRIWISAKVLKQMVARARSKAAGENTTDGWKYVDLEGLTFHIEYTPYGYDQLPITRNESQALASLQPGYEPFNGNALRIRDSFTIQFGSPIIGDPQTSQQATIGMVNNSAKTKRWQLDNVPADVSVGQNDFENRFLYYTESMKKDFRYRQYYDIEGVRVDGERKALRNPDGIAPFGPQAHVLDFADNVSIRENQAFGVWSDGEEWDNGGFDLNVVNGQKEVMDIMLGSLPLQDGQRIKGFDLNLSGKGKSKAGQVRVYLLNRRGDVIEAMDFSPSFTGNIIHSRSILRNNVFGIRIEAQQGRVQVGGAETKIYLSQGDANTVLAPPQSAGADASYISLHFNSANQNAWEIDKAWDELINNPKNAFRNRSTSPNQNGYVPEGVRTVDSNMKRRYFYYNTGSDFRARQYLQGRVNGETVTNAEGVWNREKSADGKRIGKNNVVRISTTGSSPLISGQWWIGAADQKNGHNATSVNAVTKDANESISFAVSGLSRRDEFVQLDLNLKGDEDENQIEVSFFKKNGTEILPRTYINIDGSRQNVTVIVPGEDVKSFTLKPTQGGFVIGGGTTFRLNGTNPHSEPVIL